MALQDKAAYNEYMRVYMKRRYYEKRQIFTDALGGKCEKCGGRNNLEFDHVNPDAKSFTIGKGWSTTDDRLIAEIAKCRLLCKECHTDRHDNGSFV